MAEKLLEEVEDIPIIWRNLAVALRETGGSEEEILHTFEKAFQATAQRGDAHLSNVFYPYLGFLLTYRRFDDAQTLFEKTLRENPRSTDVLQAYAEFRMSSFDDLRKAEQCYNLLIQIADEDSDESAALEGQNGLKKLAALQALQNMGIIYTSGSAQGSNDVTGSTPQITSGPLGDPPNPGD